MSEIRKIPCYCDNLVEIEVPEEADLSSDPGLADRIIEGRFLSATCPKCGKILKPEFPVRVVDSAKGWELFLVPELDRGPFLLGKSGYSLRDPARGRAVIGYPELAEKLAILRSGLDDRVVELIKFYLSEKAGDAPDLEIYFKERSEGRLVFHLLGLKAEEVGISRLPEELYEKMARELPARMAEEPFSELLRPPYVSYKKAADEERS